jgi:hypothetical protein
MYARHNAEELETSLVGAGDQGGGTKAQQICAKPASNSAMTPGTGSGRQLVWIPIVDIDDRRYGEAGKIRYCSAPRPEARARLSKGVDRPVFCEHRILA